MINSIVVWEQARTNALSCTGWTAYSTVPFVPVQSSTYPVCYHEVDIKLALAEAASTFTLGFNTTSSLTATAYLVDQSGLQ